VCISVGRPAKRFLDGSLDAIPCEPLADDRAAFGDHRSTAESIDEACRSAIAYPGRSSARGRV
jgi:hypothetical protein